MKKALSLLLAIVMVMGLGVTALAADKATVTVETAAAEAKPGDEVTLKVDLANNPGFAALGAFVDYDHEKLELVSINNKYTRVIDGEETEFYYLCGAEPVINLTKIPADYQAEKLGLDKNKTYGFITSARQTDNTKNGTLFSVTFKVKEEAETGLASVSVALDNFNDYLGNYQANEVVAGGINVKGAPVVCKHPNLEAHAAVEATCTKGGNDAYWTCPDCGKMFSDEGVTAIDAIPTTKALGHNYENGECTRCGKKMPTYLMYVEIEPNVDADGDGIIEVAVGDKLTAKVMLRSSEDTTLQGVNAFVGIDSMMDAVTPTGGAYNLTVTEDESRGGYTLYSDKLSVEMKAGEAIELTRVQMTVTDRRTHGLFTIVVPRPYIKVAGNDEEIMASYQGAAMKMSTQIITFVTASGSYKVEYPLNVLPDFDDVTEEGATTDKAGYTFTGWEPKISPVIEEVTYRAQYTANEYKIKFVDENGATVEEVPFTYEETTEITEPAVPAKDGYEGVWGSYDLTKPEDQTVTPVYTKLEDKPKMSFEDYAYAGSDQILLVVQADKLESGNYKFDGQPLYWTDSKDYGTKGAYITLVDKAWAKKSAEEAAKALTIDTAAEAAVKVDRDGDVNGDGVVDVHDAGVVYKMLSTNGDAFKDLTILDRLECDVVTAQANASYRGSIADVNAIMDIYLAD